MTVEPMPVSACAAVADDTKGFTPGRRRMIREFQTLEAMVRVYCRDRHGRRGEVCEDCQGLLDYAHVRLQRCRFGEEKPTCAKCPVHCYQPSRREQVKTVMRYAGPRMVWKHPLMSLRHWADGFRKLRLAA